jgi:hypothetical protein
MWQMVELTAFLHVVRGACRQVSAVGGRRGNRI